MAESVAIIGGGISGLSTAYFLAKRGIPSVIFEKSDRLGGLIKTDHIDGCELEAGPDSYLASKTQVRDLANELNGLAQKIIGSNDKARRIFVVREGKLVGMPTGMAMMVPGQWGPILRSDLLGFSTKIRLLRETFTKPRSRCEDFSVRDLVTEHFGSEMVDYVTEPLLCGVFGGDAAELSAPSVLPRFVDYERRFGSLIKGVRATESTNRTGGSIFHSFEGGMQTLIDGLIKALCASVSVVHAEVTGLDRTRAGWRARFGAESIECTHVVMACPAHVSASLLDTSAPGVASELAGIPYSSSLVAMLVFDREKLGHKLDGFGFLVPRQERRTIAAATWTNTKFPSRIRAGLAALRAFIVGDQATRLISENPSKEKVSALVLDDFRRVMGIQAEPLFSTLYSWPHSMPQYVVGHAARVLRLRNAAKLLPGLHLIGSMFDGIGIPDCIRHAKDVAKQIEDYRV